MRPGDEPTEPPEWWYGEEDTTEEVELTIMSESEWRRCTPPMGGAEADLVAFAASGDECWGREFDGEFDANRAYMRYKAAHRRSKRDLEGVRVVKRGRKVFLVREGA